MAAAFRSIGSLCVLTRRTSIRIVALCVALAFAFGAWPGFAEQASAQGTTVENSTQTNAFANASWCESGPEGETCYEAILEVFDPDKFGGVAACLSITGTGAAGDTFEEGCADAAGAFVLDPKDLSTASLSPLTFQMNINVCDPVTKVCDFVPSRTVELAATWTGETRTEKIIDRLGDSQNNCETHIKIKGLIQTATTTLVLDGVSHEGTGELQFLEVQERTFCRQP